MMVAAHDAKDQTRMTARSSTSASATPRQDRCATRWWETCDNPKTNTRSKNSSSGVTSSSPSGQPCDLHDAGYNILTFDLRNCGRSGEANGGISGLGLLECRDVVGSIRYAKSSKNL